MKWSDVPISIEVRRDGSAWRCVGRMQSDTLAEPTSRNLWETIYRKYDGCELRVVEADRASRKVLRSFP